MFSQQIKKIYNQVAHLYNQDRLSLGSSRYLHKFEQMIPRASSVLDLGCGNGVPIDEYLIKKGHLVTGIDISERQIHSARKSLPTGNFVVKDLMELKDSEYQVEAVVCYYTLFHLPRKKHLSLLKKIHSFLKPEGILLITMGEKDFEGWHDFYTQRMWSSQYGPKKNRQILKEAGFEILMDEMDSSNREQHQVMIAQRI